MNTKILVVEDEPLIRMALSGMLMEQGYVVLEADTADEARKHFDDHADIDVLLTDYDMPGSMNGLDLSRWARAQLPAIGVIVVSGAVSRQDLLLTQGVEFIGKPYQEKDVLRLILQVSNRRADRTVPLKTISS